ncbi:hypothetical protein [Myxococcus sp. CA040A]|uniref:hypothetical protein n=1 Tax=Myxococcus sp. CA040A TaxID=2741738 RepID=UPI00157B22E4|nr:hypothetical protein [Myxococcus sp. CA040A]NTX08967.1 hypothetical protein [Myxococcus sp. CA040A]
MTDAERVHHADEFLAQFQTMSEEAADALVERLAGAALPRVLEEYTGSILKELAPMLPEDVKEAVLDRVASLMLIGYLVRASEDAATPPRVPPASA